jgi:hypothetical protein
MGLDMYLTKKTYVGAEFDFREVKGTIDITIKGVSLPIEFKRVTYIYEEVAYWRKANAIHNWFVQNCQDGIDECQETYVPMEKLEKLLDVCKQVQKNHELAPSLLPTTKGFFFGGTEYDKWYFDDIKYTIKVIKRVLKEQKISQQSIYYSSSW